MKPIKGDVYISELPIWRLEELTCSETELSNYSQVHIALVAGSFQIDDLVWLSAEGEDFGSAEFCKIFSVLP